MDKWEVLVLGVVSIVALLFMLVAGYRSITGSLIQEYEEVYELGTEILKHAPQHYPRFSYIPLAAPGYDPAELPDKDYLTPETVGFQVNRIPISFPNYNFPIGLKRDRIHTYSGSAGHYEEDPRPFLQGFLCAYAYKVLGAPLRCERVPLGYADGKVTFARGYAPDEYIAYQAAGTDFAALFVLANPEYGILAASNVAYLKWVED